MDDRALDARLAACERQITRLRRTLGLAALAIGLFGAAVLSGVTDELPGASVTQLSGQFLATVDGKEVFTTKRLGG